MTLADEATTGSADREAVAIALGWKKKQRDDSLFGLPYAPDYQNDLAAVLAEIERRGWVWGAGSYPFPWLALRLPFGPWADYTTGTTIANAACAALLKALENSDG